MSLTLPFELTNNQLEIVDKICNSIVKGEEYALLAAITGAGKTPIIAMIIDKLKIPTLIFSHNKILAHQLFEEAKIFNSEDTAINYFISHFSHYQAESYIPSIDKYFEKETIVDPEIDRQRILATADILKKDFSITVASVSCIFGAGYPIIFEENIWKIQKGDSLTVRQLSERLILKLFYQRVASVSDIKWYNQFCIIGDQIFLLDLKKNKVCITIAWDIIESITIVDYKTNKKIEPAALDVYPAQHYFSIDSLKKSGLELLREDLQEQLTYLKKMGKMLEAMRLEQRTRFDMEMIEEIGYVNGMENYVKYFSPWNLIDNRPKCLLDYYRYKFGDKFLTIIDESPSSITQLKGLIKGQHTTKQTLIDFGFRLPSCQYNRPLSLDEFLEISSQKLFVSATPGPLEYELTKKENVFSLYIRPTGIIEPEVFILPTHNQIDSILEVLSSEKNTSNQSLIITLTIKDSEHLNEYLMKLGYNCAYIHSKIKPKDRIKIFNDIRENKFQVVIGVQMMREGIDLPNLTNVFILDADKDGFLRNTRTLIQIAGRAARNMGGKVYLFADKMSKSMNEFLDNTTTKRELQQEHNKKYSITPTTVNKHVKSKLLYCEPVTEKEKMPLDYYKSEILKASKQQDFEYAIELRNNFKKFYPKQFSKFSLKHD